MPRRKGKVAKGKSSGDAVVADNIIAATPSTPSRGSKKSTEIAENTATPSRGRNNNTASASGSQDSGAVQFSTPHAEKKSKAPNFSNEKKSASRRSKDPLNQSLAPGHLDLSTTPKKELPPSQETNISSTPSDRSTSKLAVNKSVEDVYRILRLTTGQLGGNGYMGAIYGELTMRSMQRVLNIMQEKCSLTANSRFIDVGAGLGKPNFHAAQDPRVRLSIGIELENIRWQLSMHNMQTFLTSLTDESNANENRNNNSTATSESNMNGGVNFVLGDIDNAQSLDPFTHIYMFDLGFPPPLQKNIAKKFNQSLYAKCLVSYRPPRRVIEEYGYAVDFIDQVLCSMHGSGEGHTAYFYMRNNKPPRSPKMKNQHLLSLPLRTFINDTEEEQEQEEEHVYSDEIFYHASKLALGPVSELVSYVDNEMIKYMKGERPKRDRKQRIITDASDF